MIRTGSRIFLLSNIAVHGPSIGAFGHGIKPAGFASLLDAPWVSVTAASRAPCERQGASRVINTENVFFLRRMGLFFSSK